MATLEPRYQVFPTFLRVLPLRLYVLSLLAIDESSVSVGDLLQRRLLMMYRGRDAR